MALSEAEAITQLTMADIDGALALSDSAGWNQTADDWRVFIEHGRVFGCRDDEGRLLATAAVLPCQAAVGWISMVLVDATARHRGLATALLADCMRALADDHRLAVLDATPAGAAVYRRFGFLSGFGFERWEGVGTAHEALDEATTAAPIEATVADAEAIAALDTAATGTGRAFLVRDFLARPATQAWLSADRSGFVIARAGRRATQIGPLVAATQSDAIALLQAALVSSTGRVFIDVPVRCGAIADVLMQRGFARQRPFTRMALDAASPVLVASDRVFALAGPEFG